MRNPEKKGEEAGEHSDDRGALDSQVLNLRRTCVPATLKSWLNRIHALYYHRYLFPEGRALEVLLYLPRAHQSNRNLGSLEMTGARVRMMRNQK